MRIVEMKEENEPIRKTNRRKKAPLNLYVDKNTAKFYKENAINTSQIVNDVLKCLKEVMEDTDHPDAVQITAHISQFGKITVKKDGPVGIRTPDLQHVRLLSDLDADSTDLAVCESENFSTLGEKRVFPFVDSEGREIRGEPALCIAAFMKGKEKVFDRFCLTRHPVTSHEGTRKGYLTALRKMDKVFIPSDLTRSQTLTKTQLRALGKFYRFVEEEEYMSGYNGYTFSQWRGTQHRVGTNEGSRAGWKTKDLTPDEVKAAALEIGDKSIRLFYILLGYSGARVSHLFRWLTSDDKIIEDLPDKIIRGDVRDQSAGTKNEAYFYFPSWLKEDILEFEPVHSMDYYTKVIKTTGKEGRPINASSLRKWNFNILLDNMERMYANAIQGRAADGVDAQHYFDAAGKAAKWYPKALPELKKGLPMGLLSGKTNK